MSVWSFLRNESGAVSVDWVVLTAALVGTGLAVLNTVSSGLQVATGEVDGQLQGQIIKSTFGRIENLEMCQNQMAGLQGLEDSRVASAIAQGDAPDSVDVVLWNSVSNAEQTNEDLVSDYAEALADEQANGGGWSRASTIRATIECELHDRDLLF